MAGITTHVLDTVTGRPGAGMRIDFSRLEGGVYKLVKTVYSNKEGRTDQMVLAPEATQVGQYELKFYVEEYFTKQGTKLPDPAFIDEVPVRFSRCSTPRSTITCRCWRRRGVARPMRGS